MSEHIYFFDDCQQLIKIVNEEKIIESIEEKEITASKEELMNSTLSVTILFDEELTEAAFMAVKEKNNSYGLYRIVKINDPENQLIFVGIDFAPDELDGYIVKDIRPKNESISSITKRLLEGTEWILGHVDSGIKNMSGTFYYISVKDALKQLQALGCEILFSCDLNADGISEKRVDIYRKIGTESTTRYTYGDKALTVVKELGRSQVYTSIIGRGKGEEVGDGYGRRLEFSDLEWKISKGDPLDKPKGQNWLEYPEMTKLYGIPTKDGKMRKREKVIIFDDEEDKKALLNNTYSELVECSRPLVQFKATITEGDVIGNTVTIHRYDRGYHYKTRIFRTRLDRLTGVTEASIGDNLTSNMSRKTSQMISGLQTLDSNKMNFYSSEEISKWQSDIIRGAKGGSILLMSPSDLGKSESREPFQMVWMNGDSLENSNHFLVANSEGIGFIEGDFNLDNFKTAWTIDGVFNASFIKSGILEGIIVRTSDEKSITTVALDGGKIEFYGFQNKKRIGRITAASSSDAEGIVLLLDKGNFLQLTDGDGGRVIEIPYNSKTDAKLLNTFGTMTHDGDLHVKGDLYIERGKLFIDGQEIKPGGNGSGGGGGGGVPPELTTDQEKNAWAIWQFFKEKGWSIESIAGMLGNMQSESGIMPDIDEISGGGGYGLVQWTPKSKLVDWCNERGLDYRTLEAQCQRIQWEMENNVQWFPNYERPDLANISFREFTQLKDVKLSADYFIAFYEHPKDVNQPIRGTQAQYWYDKLKDLKPPTAGWLSPVRANYAVTQEWDEPDYNSGGAAGIHGGIDLASVPAGSTPDIYAANSGTIMTVGSNPDLEGNYIMIDHGNSYYTYYGHLSSVNVKQGDKVTNATVIGVMGTTGASTGVHLHFEVRRGGSTATSRINPRDVIKF